MKNDKLKVSFNKKFSFVTTRRQMASQFAINYDLLGIASPCLLGGKLILQRVATAKFAWDDALPADIIENWNSWIFSLKGLSCVELERNCFANNETLRKQRFCNLSIKRFLRRI